MLCLKLQVNGTCWGINFFEIFADISKKTDKKRNPKLNKIHDSFAGKCWRGLIWAFKWIKIDIFLSTDQRSKKAPEIKTKIHTHCENYVTKLKIQLVDVNCTPANKQIYYSWTNLIIHSNYHCSSSTH